MCRAKISGVTIFVLTGPVGMVVLVVMLLECPVRPLVVTMSHCEV